VDILHLIDRLEEMVGDARRMPVGHGVVLDRRRLLELVDQMRSSVPWEVKEAAALVQSKEALLAEARREADGILNRAEHDAESRLDEAALIVAAEREAKTITSRAEDRAQALLDDAQTQVQARLRQAEQAATNQMDEADRYALEMLKRLDQQLTAFSTTIKSGIGALEERTENEAAATEVSDEREVQSRSQRDSSLQ
jgi:cell division septum initiation protein DivIVA